MPHVTDSTRVPKRRTRRADGQVVRLARPRVWGSGARARWLGPGSRTGLCDGASVAVLRWLFDLVIIVGYFATALVLGSWLMVAAPFVLAGIAIVITIVRVRLGGS
jgi:hypothetical protein